MGWGGNDDMVENMAKDFQETTCTRYKKEWYKGGYYIVISENDVMITVPHENRPDMADERSALTAHCRMASLARNHGASWEDIAYQLKASCLSPTTPTAMLAQAIEEHLEGECQDSNQSQAR